MKVVIDFLPSEYKSFVLDVRALGVLVVFALATVAVCFLNHKDYEDRIKGLDTQITREQGEIGSLEQKIRKKSYNQEEIQMLIDKFNFIREAVGARDHPFLRFYHCFEKAIPIGEEDGKRRVAIKSLSEGRAGRYRVHGLARHWDDLLAFEDNLNSSTFFDPQRQVEVTNFSAVKMGSWTQTEAGIDFTAEFTFQP